MLSTPENKNSTDAAFFSELYPMTPAPNLPVVGDTVWDEMVPVPPPDTPRTSARAVCSEINQHRFQLTALLCDFQ